MATLKFKETSPYQQPKPKLPEEDYLYPKYEENLALRRTTAVTKHNFAIFGIGRAGTIHLSNLVNNPRANILYIIDDVPEKHPKLREYWGLTHTKFLTSKDANQVYNDSNVDIVVIATPTHAHEDIVTKSLAAKKAVFCEKPIAENNEATLRCYKKAEQIGKPLFSAFNRRFDPAYSELRDRVRQGEVGHVQTIKVCSRDSPLPTIDYLANSGGIFHDCAVHDIDMICWVLGEYPMEVSTIATSNVDEIRAIDDFDTVAITMKFKSGTVGMIDLSRNSCYGYDQRLEAFGARGMIRVDNEQPLHSLQTFKALSCIQSPPIWYSFASRYKNAYTLEMEHFLDVVENKTVMKVQSFETLAVSRIATAAEESARKGIIMKLKWD